MNAAFYVDTLSESEQNQSIFALLNTLVETNAVKDASLFYNKIDFNSVPPKFGMFNATELWGFNGVLISTTAKNALAASSTVSDIQNYYLFNRADINIFELIRVSQQMTILVSNPEDQAYVKRVTGCEPLLTKLDDETILALMKGESCKSA
jgi:hypothetical protein